MAPRNDLIGEFHRLHSAGCFVMPNPWDVGSACALEQMGFPALATTSAGFTWTLGRADAQVTLEEALQHFAVIAEAVQVPVNADFAGGFAARPDMVAANVTRAVETGIGGCSAPNDFSPAGVHLVVVTQDLTTDSRARGHFGVWLNPARKS